MKSPIIVALDNINHDKSFKMVYDLIDYVHGFKVNLKFLLQNPDFKFPVDTTLMLDLKLHDTTFTNVDIIEFVIDRYHPNTITIHCSNGDKSLFATNNRFKSQVGLVGITVLTTLTQQESVDLFGQNIPSKVYKFTIQAKSNQIHGLVCSPEDLKHMAEADPYHKVKRYCPGIRYENDGMHSRFTTPKKALTNGADYLIIGRPITKAKEPVEICKRILDDYNESM